MAPTGWELDESVAFGGAGPHEVAPLTDKVDYEGDRSIDDDDDERVDEDLPRTGGAAPSALATVRVDKWLWAARLFKSRSLASQACDAGHVKIEGTSVKASRCVKRGEQLNAVTPGGPRHVEVIELADKRGSAPMAAKLYVDHTPPPPPRDPLAEHRDRGLGRPSKRDRRLIDAMRGK